MATATGLQPTTVEKDYVLSWVLFGVTKQPQLAEWIFKGGTCLKKCYFDTYRFSEDLDFTVPNGALYESAGIEAALKELGEIVYDETGIRVVFEGLKESHNKRMAPTFEGKLSYAGPLNYDRARSNPRIKFDITNDEVLAEEPDLREVFHPYSDAPSPRAKVQCYSIHEILAEKTRAMVERAGRARDIYDVIQISRNFRDHIQVDRARACLKKKFEFKSLPDPTAQFLIDNIDLASLKANWEGQLSHQVPQLIPVEHYYNALPIELSWWITAAIDVEKLTLISEKENESILPKDYFHVFNNLGRGERASVHSVSISSAGYLYQVRYAARNRLCIRLRYDGVDRIVEPYSLRRPSTGNILLYAYERLRGDIPSQKIKAFNVPKIEFIEITKEVFHPRYVVEL